MINQLKAQLKKFWKWLVALIMGGVVLAAGIALQPEEIPFIVVNGERIEFPYTDENEGEDLIIYTDKETYGGWDESIVYVMVENKSGKGQAINLQVFFSDESKSVAEISRLKQNVPYEVDVPDYQTIDYDCSITTAVSSTTEETITEKKTCQMEEQTGSHKETRYRDEWQPQQLEDFSIHENNILIASQAITEKDKEGFEAKKKIQTPILDDEITYYRIKIKFPNQTKDEFFIETIGSEDGYGHLDPWYDSSWLYKKKISINPAVVDADLANFPVLVALASSTNFDFTKAREDGFDVIFTNDDEDTLLDFERERYSTTTEQAEFWVEIPFVSSSTAATTTFYMYYGNSGASDISSSTAVWDSSFQGVVHLNQAAETTQNDSTANARHFATVVGTPQLVDGKVGKAQYFANEAYQRASAAVGVTNAWTIEGLIKLDNTTGSKSILAFKAADNKNRIMSSTEIDTVYGGSIWVYNSVGTIAYGSISQDAVAATTWYHIAVTWDGTNRNVYRNGVVQSGWGYTTGSGGTQVAADRVASIGGFADGGGTMDGIIDEVRWSSTARSVAWIKATYNSNFNTLLVYGKEESSVVPQEPQMEVMIIE